MGCCAIILAACLSVTGAGGGGGGPEYRSRLGQVTTTQPSTKLPDISFPDLVLLVETARQAFRAAVAGLPERGPGYRPPALRGLNAVVHLTLRRQGAALAEAESRELDVVDAAVMAGTLLGKRTAEKELGLPEEGFGLEFELMGPPANVDVEYGAGGIWPEALYHAFEPAVEGIGVAFRGRLGRTRPSEIVSHNYTPDVALRAAEAGAGIRHADKLRHAQDIRYSRYRAYHLWQPSRSVRPERLLRGSVIVPADSVDASALDAAIERMGAYLHYRQNRDGWFSYEYLPTAARYRQGKSALVQLRALRGLAAYGAWCGRPEVASDVRKGLQEAIRFLKPLQTGRVTGAGRPEAVASGLVLWMPGQESRLEASALLLLAMIEGDVGAKDKRGSDLADGLDESHGARAGLIEGLLASQDADGRLEMMFHIRAEDEPEDATAAGWALLALAGSDRSQDDMRIDHVLQRALTYYRGQRELTSNPVSAGVTSRAFAQVYARTNDARASDFAFEMLDRFVRLQATAATSAWPELYGAIDARQRGEFGVDTSSYLAALADGLSMAERIGDRPRAERYRGAVKAAARFVLQLEIREAGCYYMRSPRDAMGGVRASPWCNRIRVDHCADAVWGLMRAREALYGPRKRH